jgi:hypothetical protein
VLTVRLTVAGDLEPVWSLVSDRAKEQGQTRNLNWGDRVRIAPTRIGVTADYHLAWGRGSVLNRISEERADASAALAKAARDARAAFGDDAQDQLGETLKIVAALRRPSSTLPTQACPIMGGQGSRSQPGEKLRLLSYEFFR